VVLLVIKLDHYGVLNVLKSSKKEKKINQYSISVCFADGIAVLLVGVH
jgi:hypothetical protein